MAAGKKRVHRFQEPYAHFIAWSGEARESIRHKVENLYRDCQNFATEEIEKLTSEVEIEIDRQPP